MKLGKEELDIIRQWYNAVYDLNRDYLNCSDVILISKILEELKI